MQKRYAVLGAFIAICFIIFLGRDLPPEKFLYNSFQRIFAVPEGILYSLRINFGRDNGGEIESLKKENTNLTQKLLGYQRIKRDNEALRSQFETAATQNYKMVPARIIGFLGQANAPTALLINVGEKSGVKRGMAVVSGTNLVGKIGGLAEYTSIVDLVSDQSFSEVAKTSENGSLGVARGQQDFILLDQVSIKDHLTTGEPVLTRGAGDTSSSLVPEGLVIGKISSIYKNESMPYQTAKIMSQIPIFKLENVFVILGF